jgi:hypothetical protein
MKFIILVVFLLVSVSCSLWMEPEQVVAIYHDVNEIEFKVPQSWQGEYSLVIHTPKGIHIYTPACSNIDVNYGTVKVIKCITNAAATRYCYKLSK